jgi:putative toxin-antitoxin system antitoxin component (TIGR02293 family)
MTLSYSQSGASVDRATIGGKMAEVSAEMILGIKGRAGEQIRKGLPYKALLQFRQEAGITAREMAVIFDTPQRTLQRRKGTGLSKEESNALYRAARVFAQAVDFFEGDEEAARGWMREKVPALGGRCPIDMLDTDADAQLVIETLARLSEGIIT